MEELRKRLRSLKTADEKTVTLLENLFIPVTFKRNWVISYPTGISAANLYYITDGLVMSVISKPDEDYCLWIINKGFIVPGNGFLTGKKKEEVIEVLNDTKGYALNLLRTDTIARNNINMYRMLLEIYEEALVEGAGREIMLRIKNITDRYDHFLKEYPDLARKLTIEQQAKYLQVDRRYLYKIIK
ncbi:MULTISPECIES: Crp/Fnr family transcriptional regulator [Olivibacter]|uniref:Crp/Fnr family transcriptional regulator n=1 Tax=Olivibacter oleidegradans TaxID=760123 RepID=A0ABV6HIE0_9SPHI|nr:hypothetical protein [Olivibacter jilunii]